MAKMKIAAGAVAAGAIIVGTGAVAVASIPSSTGEISACRTNFGGGLRVIDTGAGQTCRLGETALTWNKQGPAGPQGPQGLQGPPGVASPNTPPTARVAEDDFFGFSEEGQQVPANGTFNATVLRLDLPPGTWSVLAKGTIGGEPPINARCQLSHGTDVLDRSGAAAVQGLDPFIPVILADVVTLPSGGEVALFCNAFRTTFVADIKMVATAATPS